MFNIFTYEKKQKESLERIEKDKKEIVSLERKSKFNYNL